jgi:hypothetical protein
VHRFSEQCFFFADLVRSFLVNAITGSGKDRFHDFYSLLRICRLEKTRKMHNDRGAEPCACWELLPPKSTWIENSSGFVIVGFEKNVSATKSLLSEHPLLSPPQPLQQSQARFRTATSSFFTSNDNRL